MDRLSRLQRLIRMMVFWAPAVASALAIAWAVAEAFKRFHWESLQNFLLKVTETPSLPIAVGLGMGVASIALLYLKISEGRRTSLPDPDIVNSLRAEVHRLRYEGRQLKDQISALAQPTVLSQGEKAKIISDLAANLGTGAIQSIFQTESKNLEALWKQQMATASAGTIIVPIVRRLSSETITLRSRARLSLSIGLGITALGIYILFSGIQAVESFNWKEAHLQFGGDPYSALIQGLVVPMAPRIGLVILIEIFAYFFLRLYKENLAESKFFQNELTNVELKMAAVEIASAHGNEKAITKALDSISQTERNFILKRGQTTVDLERERINASISKRALKGLPFRRSEKK